MKKIAFGIAAAAALTLTTAVPSQADRGWHHPVVGVRVFAGPRVFVGPRVFFGPRFFVGAPVFVGPAVSYAYPYPYAYSYESAVVDAPPAYTPPPAQPQYWYYCQDSRAYYPYVTQCPGGWMTVQPSPGPNP